MIKPALYAAAAALVVLCAAWTPLLLKGLVPLDGNVIAESFPNWSMTRRLSADSLLPAWNPWRGMGEPFLADPKTMAAYPVMGLLRGLSQYSYFLRAWVVFHTLLAAFFLGALAWRLHRCLPAAAVAAALAGLNGAFTGRVIFPNQFAAAAWLPAMLYFQQELSPLGLGLSLAMQWLAGFPPFSILGALAVFGWACGQGRRGLNCLLQACLWALGLAAVQWIAFLELLGLASRGLVLDPASARQYSLAPLQLLKEVFLPQWIYWSPSMIGDPAIVCFYAGPVAWGLAVWALWRGGKKERLLGAACAAALILSLGGHLPGFGALPFLRIFRFPANWLHPAATALALLAAAGAARLRGETWKWAAAALLTADLVAFAQAPRAAWALASFLSEPPAAALTLAEKNPLARVYHTAPLRRVWESGSLETPDDYFLMRDFLAPSYGCAFGVSEASSYQTLRLKKTNAYLDRLEKEGPRSPLADWAGIELVAALKQGALRVSRESVAFLSRPAKPRVFLENKNDGQARLVSHRPGRVAARVAAARQTAVVLSEMDYPGWRVLVDGAPVQKVLFAGAFVSVEVPAGEHDVLFVFRPLSVLLGAAISLLTACALAAKAWSSFNNS